MNYPPTQPGTHSISHLKQKNLRRPEVSGVPVGIRLSRFWSKRSTYKGVLLDQSILSFFFFFCYDSTMQEASLLTSKS